MTWHLFLADLFLVTLMIEIHFGIPVWLLICSIIASFSVVLLAFKGYGQWQTERETRIRKEYSSLMIGKPTLVRVRTSVPGLSLEDSERLLARRLEEWEKSEKKMKKLRRRYKGYYLEYMEDWRTKDSSNPPAKSPNLES